MLPRSEGHLNEAGSKIPDDDITQSEAKQINREQEPESLAQRLPNALVIGVRKCGTNALINYLNLHPDIVASTEEIHYFDENYKRGLEWYKQQMPLSKSHQVRIESSPKYFHDGKVAKLIKAFNNSIALLLVVRDPAKRIISDYSQRVDHGFEDRQYTFQQMAFKTGKNKSEQVKESYEPIQISKYINHYTRYLKEFPRSQIHIVDGDRLVSNPVEEIGLAQDFLGIGRKITDDNIYFNATKGFFCMKDYNNKSYCLSSEKGRKHPDVSPSVIEQLHHYFYPYNQQFYEAAGRIFNWDS